MQTYVEQSTITDNTPLAPTTKIVRKKKFRELVYKKEEIKPRTKPPASLLSQEVIRPDLHPSSDKAKIDITIYLPNRDSVEIVSFDCTIVDVVIKQALAHHETEKITPPLLYQQPHVYDLKIHDYDGFPSDFKLERTKTIKEYLSYEKILRKDRSGYDQVAIYEFCIVESELAKKRPKNVIGTGVNPVDISSVKAIGGESLYTVNVSIPEQPKIGSTLLAIDSTTTLTELLAMLAKKHRLKMHTDSYVFRLKNLEDQKRLMWMSNEIDKSVKLLSLGKPPSLAYRPLAPH